MTTPRPEPGLWAGSDEAERRPLVQEPLPGAYAPRNPAASDGGWEEIDDLGRDDEWGAVEYSTQAGVTGRGIILASLVAAGGAASLDFALTGGVTIFFDLWFIVICLVSAMAVRRGDLFTAGVLPPLALAVVVATVAALTPAAFAELGGFSKAFFTGLAEHAGALVAGYAIALLTVGGRVGAARGH